jgi:hypothetical protein
MSKTSSAFAIIAAVGLLAGCVPTVALEPAEDFTNPACAMVIVSLQNIDEIGDQVKRETNAQSTAAWGNPTSVILHCGVPVPAPTSALPCITVDGIDWLRDDSDAPSYVFTTYGRDPAVSVVIDNDIVPGNVAINAVTRAVSTLPIIGECTALEGLTEDVPEAGN